MFVGLESLISSWRANNDPTPVLRLGALFELDSLLGRPFSWSKDTSAWMTSGGLVQVKLAPRSNSLRLDVSSWLPEANGILRIGDWRLRSEFGGEILGMPASGGGIIFFGATPGRKYTVVHGFTEDRTIN